ncbi:MAG TPA: 16S rRNA (adenine(1518)-N(6)/adenine(1519)-N(6))-dimethyltransferase RsmA [Patescibacteria group bacterium]|jgi:16S rRNA (adenine1518-N6/adenine1519-N6)-dimethyltransferase
MERIRAKKSLGQHWLADRNAVGKVVEVAGLSGQETVVEVGSGPGVLTPLLAEQGKRVIAVELDETLVPKLEATVADRSNVEIRQADILETDTADFPEPYHVVGNVPYYITSKIIRHFLETPHRPESMTLTIQKEVAERICALPPKMSVLAVSVQLYGTPRIAGRIPAKAFRPPPEVDSAILRIENIGKDLDRTLDGVSESAVFSFVRAGFAEKRKQLHNTLAHNLDLSHEQASALLRQAGIEPNRRAETLSVEEWVTLVRQATR